MRLDALQAVLRPRSPWEATDLGFAMARTWARPLWAAWLTVLTPTLAVIWLLLWQHPLWALLLSWWLKPLWGHAALHVLSRRLFSEEPPLSETLGVSLRMAPRDLLGKLVLHRLAPWRTAVAPVFQLEGLSGATARQRRSVLLQTLRLPTVLLASVALVLEVVVASGLVATVFLALPEEPRFQVALVFERLLDGAAPLWIQLLLPLVVWTVLASVEPLVVAAGFGLYLNRRTALEGWDIELSFRGLAERMTVRGGAARNGLAPLLLLLFLGGAVCPPAGAEPAFSDAEVSAALEAVQEHPDLQTTRAVRVWRLREAHSGTAIEALWTALEDAIAWLERLLEDTEDEPEVSLPGLAALLEGLLWFLAGLVVVGTVFAVLSRGWVRTRPEARPARLSTVRGDAVLLDPARPPDDPVAQARRLWAENRPDAALGVLYGAAVYWLVHARGVAVPEGATEGEVLHLARRVLPESDIVHFRAITSGWLAAAYAQQTPTKDAFEAACCAWPALGGAP